ncbi:murein transglycosylase [Actinoplanes sp. NPDC049548]|uniref:murein transglycosylase n=1 Tax=Actinoplanes sp. NPDC049548 TaxID=3155152 RepID=UPI00342350C9
MVDGQQTPSKRPAAPHLGGPLGSSGAAPEELTPASEPASAGKAEPARSVKPAAVAEAVRPAAEAEQAKPTQAPRAAEPAQTPKPANFPKPSGTKSAEIKPSETKPAEIKPAEIKPAEIKPAEIKPAEIKPSETEPGQTAAKTEPEPGQAVGETEPQPGQAVAKTEPDPGEIAGKTETKPGGAVAKTGSERGETGAKAGTTEAAKPAGDQPAAKDSPEGGSAAPSATVAALAARGRATRVLRKANPARVARSTSDWAKRPSGRFVLPAIIALLLLGAAGTAGAYLVPEALKSVPAPSATPAFGVEAGVPSAPVPSLSGVPGAPGLSSAPAVVGGGLPTTAPVGIPGARPADALSGWAQQTGTRVGIPVVAVQAYGYAELVVGRTAPTCHLSWTTIAAIAKVESAHGSANGAVLGVDGSVSPPIFGLPLDGKGGRQLIRDTDQGLLDKDPQFDRAIGPLQFIPQTWNEISVGNAVDADNNGVSDPNDIDDASLATAVYLCKGGRDLSRADVWWDAILSYNAVRPYAQKVFDAANEYGVRSRA